MHLRPWLQHRHYAQEARHCHCLTEKTLSKLRQITPGLQLTARKTYFVRNQYKFNNKFIALTLVATVVFECMTAQSVKIGRELAQERKTKAKQSSRKPSMAIVQQHNLFLVGKTTFSARSSPRPAFSQRGGRVPALRHDHSMSATKTSSADVCRQRQRVKQTESSEPRRVARGAGRCARVPASVTICYARPPCAP